MPGNVLRLTLRQGVIFQDGTPFNADAVKFNLDRAKTDPASTIKATLSVLSSVTVVDPSTVDLTMTRAAAGALLPTLTDRAGMMVSPTAVQKAGSEAAFNAAPVGTGMYEVSGTYSPRQALSVRTWSGYWDKTAQTLGGIDFSEVPSSSLVSAIQAGDLDWDSPVTVADANSLKSASNVKVLTNPGTQFRLFIMNGSLAPFTDQNVREAVSYAIDRAAIAKALTSGTVPATYQEFPPTSIAYDPNLDKNPTYPYNPTKAMQLLQTAGVTNLTFDAYVGSASTSFVQMGELIQAQLKAVGITMNLKQVDQASAFGDVFLAGPNKTGIAPAASFGGIATPDPDAQFQAHFLTGGSTNPGQVNTPGLADIITQAEATADPATRASLYKKANDLVVTQVRDGVPIFFDPAISAIQNYVGGVTKAVNYCDANFRGVYITKGHAPISS
jgi:peptide/nickel transport system substrate-binding protein